MCCSKCNLDKKIVNKHFFLCLECNNERLYGNKYGKKYNKTYIKKRSNRRLNNKKVGKKSMFSKSNKIDNVSTKSKIKKDEDFYEKCFNNSDHKCEECGVDLPDIFRDIDGRVVARWRYSHIVPKSIAPELRRSEININHLCLKDHQRWENGDKKSMRIYEKNKARLPQFF